MFGRNVVSGVVGLLIVGLLFLAMQAMIARSQRPRLRPDTYPIVDFVRLPPEFQPPREMIENHPRSHPCPKPRRPRVSHYRRQTSPNSRHRIFI